MRALIVDSADGPLRLASIQRPVPGVGQVLVRIKASGVNALDGKIRAGQAVHARQPLPAVLGMDLAGTVEVVGAGVSGWLPGDEVYAMATGIGGVQGSLDPADTGGHGIDLITRQPSTDTCPYHFNGPCQVHAQYRRQWLADRKSTRL